MSNQGDARRRAQTAYDSAVKAKAKPSDIAKLRSALDAAKAEEERAKKSSGGAASRAFGW